MAVTELWLVRHGESIANSAATHAELDGLDHVPIDLRDADVPLSETGEQQAGALSSWMAQHRSSIDTFWVSPYLRARQTLAIALNEAAPDAVIAVDERLRDRELGILDLLTSHGVARLQPAEAERRRRLGKFYHRPPGGESWADVALRLRSVLRDVLSGPGSSALVVAHDAVVMLVLYLLLPMEEAQLLEFAASHTVLNASLTHVVHTESGWELAEFSEVEHLQKEGAPVTVHPGSPDVKPA
jgi:probable phosphoglycerate mutase